MCIFAHKVYTMSCMLTARVMHFQVLFMLEMHFEVYIIQMYLVLIHVITVSLMGATEPVSPCPDHVCV